MKKPLTDAEKAQVRALMKIVDDGRKKWLWPTNESVKLEREFSGELAEARQRVAKFREAKCTIS